VVSSVASNEEFKAILTRWIADKEFKIYAREIPGFGKLYGIYFNVTGVLYIVTEPEKPLLPAPKKPKLTVVKD
jgi:hypothetical protein